MKPKHAKNNRRTKETKGTAVSCDMVTQWHGMNARRHSQCCSMNGAVFSSLHALFRRMAHIPHSGRASGAREVLMTEWFTMNAGERIPSRAASSVCAAVKASASFVVLRSHCFANSPFPTCPPSVVAAAAAAAA